MQTRIQKWGNSLALRIPKSFALETNLEQDTLVEVTLEEGKLVIAPIAPVWTLDRLLSQITPENLHTEQETRTTVGSEAW